MADNTGCPSFFSDLIFVTQTYYYVTLTKHVQTERPMEKFYESGSSNIKPIFNHLPHGCGEFPDQSLHRPL
jgi:hypothetical protein